MSLGGDLIQEYYDTLIQSFLVKLEQRLENADDKAYFAIWNIVDEYKEHFKNNGIYT